MKGKPNVNRKDRSNYSCFVCGTTTTCLDKDRYNNPKWYHQFDINTGVLIGVVCSRCYIRLNRGYRIGEWRGQPCSECGRKQPKKAHWPRDPNKPWEILCDACHWKRYPKLKYGSYEAYWAWKKVYYSDPVNREKLRQYRLKQVIPFKDSKIEIALQNALMQRGISFQKHIPIIGQPDIFITPNICIFADGDYFHGNPKYYTADSILKKGYTAERIWDKDARVTVTLELMGMRVLRFWEDDINKRLDWCISEILKSIPVSSLVISK